MPQIAIEYSANLEGAFDPAALASALHATAVEAIGVELESCKTRLVPVERWVIGDGGPRHAMLHVDFRILSGRDQTAKTRLGEGLLARAAEALKGAEGRFDLQVTVEVHDLDRANYHKISLARAG